MGNVMMRRLPGSIAVFILLTGWAFAQCVLMEDGRQLILENEFLKLTIQPDKGAGGSALVYKKTGNDLTSWPEHGILLDRFWIAGRHTDFYLTPYSFKVLEKSPQKVSIAFSCPARSPGFTDLVLEKTITVESRKSFIDVRLKLTNNGKATLPVGMWAFQDLRVPGTTNTFYAPTEPGVDVVQHYPVDGGKAFKLKGGERFMYNFSRGWTGVIAENGAGAVCLMQPEQVSCLYNWFAETINGCTVEWIYNRFELLPGKSWETRYAILPFSGLKSLDGAGGNMAGSIVADKLEQGKTTVVRARIAGGEDRTVTVAFLMKRLPDGEFRKIAQKEVKLQADKPVEVPFEAAAEGDGTTVLRFEIRDGGQLLFDMERPVVVGEAGGTYTIARNFTSVGQEMTRFKNTAATSLEEGVSIADGRAFLDHKLSMEYVTPHMDWCRPYQGGKINALFSLPIFWGGSVRQIIEVAQRMDLNFDAVLHRRVSALEKRRICAYEEDDWKKKLPGKFDCLIMSSAGWPMLTDEIRATILKKVADGMGLVFVQHPFFGPWSSTPAGDPLYKLWQTSTNVTPEFASQIPLDAMARFQEKDMVKFAAHSNGRIFFVRYRDRALDKTCFLVPIVASMFEEPPVLEVQGFPAEEYGYSLFAKVILAAAGKTPSVTVSIPMESGNAADLAKGTLDALIQSPKAFPAEVSLRLIDRFNNELINQKKEVAVRAGQTKVSFSSRFLAGGLHVMDIQIRDKNGKVVAWTSKSLTVTPPVRLSQLKIPGTDYLEGEIIEGTITVEGTASGNEKLFVFFELWDNLGRMMARVRSEVGELSGKKEIPVRLKVVYPLARQLWATAKILRGDQVLDEARREVFTDPHDKPVFDQLDCGDWSLKRIQEEGFTGTVYGGMETLRLNMTTVPWGNTPNIYANFDGMSDATGTIRTPCLSDPQFLAKSGEELKSFGGQSRLAHPLAYIFCDEWGYGGRCITRPALCHSPSCLKGYREYLQGKYKTIASLNTAWQSSYANFEEIEPILPGEVSERVELIKRGTPQNLTCYIDHCMFVESVVADFMEFCQKSLGYKLRMGLSGTQVIGSERFVGLDWWKLTGKRNMRCVTSYGGAQIDIINSFKHPDDFVSSWSGYDSYGDREKADRQAPWRLLFQGADACSYYFDSSYSSIHYPDWSARPYSKWVVEQIALIGKGGIGRLIKKAEKVQDGVAVLYSQSSIHANRVLAMVCGGVPMVDANFDSWVALLKAIGVQYRFISYEQVEQGGLKDCKALIMPFCYALSPAEKAQIEKFAQAGGTVIADVLNPAFGTMCGGADLQDLFGIEQTGMPVFKLASFKDANNSASVKFIEGAEKITLKSAQAQRVFEDNAPAVITRPVGKGRAVCLNLSVADYSVVSLGGAGGEVAAVVTAQQDRKDACEELIYSVLTSAGVRPEMTVRAATGKNLGAEIYRFKDGVVDYLGLATNGGEVNNAIAGSLITEKDYKPAVITFGRKVHVYDVINKSYLGFKNKLDFVYVDGKASLFAVMDEQPSGMEVGIRNSYQPGDMLEAPVTVKPALSGVVIVSVADAKGRERYRQEVAVSGGKGVLRIPFALNDPAGSWLLTATDVATGYKVEKRFSLKRGT